MTRAASLLATVLGAGILTLAAVGACAQPAPPLALVGARIGHYGQVYSPPSPYFGVLFLGGEKPGEVCQAYRAYYQSTLRDGRAHPRNIILPVNEGGLALDLDCPRAAKSFERALWNEMTTRFPALRLDEISSDSEAVLVLFRRDRNGAMANLGYLTLNTEDRKAIDDSVALFDRYLRKDTECWKPFTVVRWAGSTDEVLRRVNPGAVACKIFRQ